ncbi:MAG: PaaI family thioesterase [Lachnospiraceae bacterium]|nr:PaaI family thioesterase [Lachnospiraceae bacterium]
MNTIEDVRNYFRNDLFATEATGAVIEDARPGYARISCRLEEKHKNARGAVMGGVYLTLADFACGVAGNFNIGEEAPCVSMTLNMSFLSAAKGETLYAEAKAVKNGRSVVYMQIEITDDLGTLVAQATGTNFRLPAKD